VLNVVDGCNQSGSQEMTYIVENEQGDALDVTIVATPIYGYEDLLVDVNAIISG
jgi:hypothetical protein